MKDTTKELFREIAFQALAARMTVTLELTDNDEHYAAVVIKRDNGTQALKLTCSPFEDDDEGESIIIDDLGSCRDDQKPEYGYMNEDDKPVYKKDCPWK